jgi:HEAT repeat protein
MEETMANPADDPADTGAKDMDSLLAELSSKKGLTRQRARLALTDIGKPAVPGLLIVLGSPNPDIRWEAAKALGEIGDPSAALALVHALEDRTFGVRWLAAEALIGLHQDAVIPLLQALVRGARSVWLREGALHVLRALAKESLTEQLKPVIGALGGSQPGDEVPVAAGLTLQAIAGPDRTGGHQTQ